MANMNSIINTIKGLDEYVNAMKKHEPVKRKQEDLDNLLMHIGNLKKWAGIDKRADPNSHQVNRENLIELPEYKLKQIENAIRLSLNAYNMRTKETCLFREMCKASEFAQDALKATEP